MPACRICQHTFKSLMFQTEHIDICTRCVNTLNESPEPAKNAEVRLAQMLKRGMQRNAERDLQSDEEWKRRKAKQTLEDIEAAVADKIHDWITDLLKKPENSTRDFKIMRAHRRGLLRMDGHADYPSPTDWKVTAQRIRRRDGWKCMLCGATNTMLDVHHIVYLSHHGTNQQSNLITLCRNCHEAEHNHIFDWPESKDPESASPIQPPTIVQASPISVSIQTPKSVLPQVSVSVPAVPAQTSTPILVSKPAKSISRQSHNPQLPIQVVTTPPVPESKEQAEAAAYRQPGKVNCWWQMLAAVVLAKVIGVFGIIAAILMFYWLNRRVRTWQAFSGAVVIGVVVAFSVSVLSRL